MITISGPRTPLDERVETRRWTRTEYRRLLEVGILQENDPVELLDGSLVVCEPQDPRHATGVRLVLRALRRVFGDGWDVTPGLPVALDDFSEPEPDVAVVRGSPRDFVAEHPTSPALVVEVSLSRIAFDRKRKGGIYARARVPEYWIVNIIAGTLEVYRRPVRASSAPYGWRYGAARLLKPPACVTPLAAPGTRIPVADLLP